MPPFTFLKRSSRHRHPPKGSILPDNLLSHNRQAGSRRNLRVPRVFRACERGTAALRSLKYMNMSRFCSIDAQAVGRYAPTESTRLDIAVQ